MKIATLVIPIVLCVLLLIVPIFELVGFINGLDFQLYNEPIVVCVQAGICLAAAVALFIMRPEYGRAGRIFCSLMTPIALINAICFVNGQWPFSVFIALIWAGCTFAVYLKFVPDSFFKAASAVVSVLLTIAFVLLYLIFGIFEPIIQEKEIYESINSPNGELIADIQTVKSPFSENAVVEVRKNDPDSDALLGYYKSGSQEIYEGESYEVHTAKVYWKDDSTLVINGTEHSVKFD